ncbi:unnamed protein product [Hymenolepis diminuta]|uniref:Uncharacterized protein n=1 Tax=Hymenolepis diminuta TaxID=6216 RepID=A0A564YF32_HYMDI|nr:unnamed protein product [Hymenolepis diminuta]
MKTFVTDTGGYVHHGRPNGIWAKSVIRAQRSSLLNEVDVNRCLIGTISTPYKQQNHRTWTRVL